MKIVNTVLERLSENSTWRGLILVATALGVKLDPSMQELSLVGLINIIRKDKK
jgi:hypothetical protein